MRFNSDPEEETRENARMFAKSGAQLGAAAGGRFGPFTTGLASGLGGAVGYLTGAAVDDFQTSLESKPAVTDGGRSRASDVGESPAGTEIPVTEEP
jgi:hypothetical protein